MAEQRPTSKNNQNTLFSLLFKKDLCTVGRKSHDPCFHVFFMEARVTTFVAHCTATLMESSRRDLMNDTTEHRPILKNNQSKNYPRCGFTPKRGIAFSETGVLFFCEVIRYGKEP